MTKKLPKISGKVWENLEHQFFLCSLQDAIFSIKAGIKNVNLALARAKVTFCDSYVIGVNSEIRD